VKGKDSRHANLATDFAFVKSTAFFVTLRGVKRFRHILFWATLGAMVAMTVLCVVGAFLGADRAKVMFNSPPLWIFWALLAALLAVGMFAWVRMWRSGGLIAVHVGVLLILAGGMWGSKTAHAWRGKFLHPKRTKAPEGYLLLNPHDVVDKTSRQLWNLSPNGPPVPAGTLPFDVEVRRAWVEYYPPEEEQWALMGLTHDKKGAPRKVTPLSGLVGLPSQFPAVDGEVTVLGYNHTLRQIELQLTHAGETMTNSITVGPADEPTVLPLADAFDAPRAWREAGRPRIVLLPPPQAVRDYKAELAVLDASGSVKNEVIEVNHPFHTQGYHFYLSAFDPPLALVVKAVSDDGLYWVYAGFALLMLGVILRLWIKPAVRRGGRDG